MHQLDLQLNLLRSGTSIPLSQISSNLANFNQLILFALSASCSFYSPGCVYLLINFVSCAIYRFSCLLLSFFRMMVGGCSNQEEVDKNPSNSLHGGVTRSCGTTVSGGQSVSTSSSMGSPSRSEQAATATPVSENTFSRKLNHLDLHGNDDEAQGAANKKKKRGQRAVGGDKNGRGLRQFSMKVCEKVESKGRTTYNEVADELVAEFADPTNGLAPDQLQYDEKNIRRRVYDALNVLMAMDIISKDKKDIQWKGLPRTTLSDVEELKTERITSRNKIEKKATYLRELEEQYVGIQNLIHRNEQLYSTNAPTGAVALPFILVQTRPNATVEVELSEDMQLVHFDFNSTPFELHDDNYVLKAMKFCERPQGDGNDTAPQVSAGGEGCSNTEASESAPNTQLPATNTPGKPPTTARLPGILKAGVKHES